jgi:hypothetical protein
MKEEAKLRDMLKRDLSWFTVDMAKNMMVNIGTKHSTEYALNPNSIVVHRTILPILQVELPTLKIKDLKYYNKGKRQWCLYVKNKLYLRYDRHHGLDVYTAYKDYVKCIQDVVRYHFTHSVIAIHTYEGILQNVYRAEGKQVDVVQVDYRSDLKPIFSEMSLESLPIVVGKDVRSYLKERA